jgi:16S rRNA (guanine527-N7)-methyltransferase
VPADRPARGTAGRSALAAVVRTGSPHRVPLRRLPLDESAALRLEVYLDTLEEWNRRVNLTGARTPTERVSRLVEAVWPLVALVPAGRLLDVGSGNGSPGLVLALVRDDLEVTLLEPRARRWAFLREAVRRTGRRAEVLRARHDGYHGPAAAAVTIRALSLPLSELAPLVEPGGRLVAVGAPPALEDPFVASGAESRPGDGVWVFRRS